MKSISRVEHRPGGLPLDGNMLHGERDGIRCNIKPNHVLAENTKVMDAVPAIRPSLASRIRAGAGPTIALVILLAGALTFGQLQKMADRAYEAEIYFHSLSTQISSLGGLGWRAVATQGARPGIDKEIAVAYTQAHQSLLSLLTQPEAEPAMETLHSMFHGYAALLDSELVLLDRGEFREAWRIDVERASPRYEAISAFLADLATLYHDKALSAGRVATGGSLLTVLAALLSIGYLSWHAQSARREVAVAQAEERIWRESERRYRDLFEANPHPMWVVDLETMAFLSVNSAAAEHYGYSREEFLGMTLWDVRPYDDPDGLLRDAQTWHKASHHHEPTRHRRKDGSLFQAQVSCRRLEVSGRPAILSLIQDVTERLRLEEELRQSQKVEAVGRLAAGVAHDFNNILTGISGYAQLLAAGFKDEQTRKQRKYAEEILGSTRRAAGLIHQLLAYSRRQVLRTEVVDLNAFLNNMQHTVQPVVGNAIRVEVSRARELWPVRFDPLQLEQVIVSLAGHARDSMPEGGCLTLETANFRQDTPGGPTGSGIPRGDYVTISVTDTGAGTSDEVRARIFDPFYSEREEGPGKGLGLAIVHGIVKQSGGFITVESAPDRGTTFRLYIPRAQERLGDPRPGQERAEPRGTPRNGSGASGNGPGSPGSGPPAGDREAA